MNKVASFLLSLISVILIVSIGTLMYVYPASDPDYLDSVNSYSYWQNDKNNMISQPEVGRYVEDFMATPSTKNKKVLFIGFDAMRVDCLTHILKSEGSLESVPRDIPNSAFAHLRQTGYMYLAYAGGERDTETEQNTSTAPGWTALATGEWGNVSGVQKNGDTKKSSVKTNILKACETYGMRSLFGVNYRSYIDKSFGVDLDYANANDLDMKIKYTDEDKELQQYLLKCVETGNELERDFIFAIYKDSDSLGHQFGFETDSKQYMNAILSADAMAYELIQKVYARPTYNEEDWLIVLASDHGGLGMAHGYQNPEERTTFFISNKPYPMTM